MERPSKGMNTHTPHNLCGSCLRRRRVARATPGGECAAGGAIHGIIPPGVCRRLAPSGQQQLNFFIVANNREFGRLLCPSLAAETLGPFCVSKNGLGGLLSVGHGLLAPHYSRMDGQGHATTAKLAFPPPLPNLLGQIEQLRADSVPAMGGH